MTLFKLDINKYLHFLIIFTPFIDLLNGYMLKENISASFSPGQMIRIALFAINSLILARLSYKRFLVVLSATLFTLLRSVVLFFDSHFRIKSDLILDIKFYYTLCFILLLDLAVKENIVNFRELCDWSKFSGAAIALMVIIPTMLDYNIESYGDIGSRGLIMEINSLTVSLILVFSYCLYDIIVASSLKVVATIFQCLLCVVALSMLGTKTSLLMMVVISVFCLLSRDSRLINKLALLILILIGYAYVKGVYTEGAGTDFVARWRYFSSRMSFFSFMLSGRDQAAVKLFDLLNNNLKFILFGGGQSVGATLLIKAGTRGGSEMDIFDMFYYYGYIFGSVVSAYIFGLFFRSLKAVFVRRSNSCYEFSYILLVIIMFFGGHILFSPLAGTFLAISISMANDEWKRSTAN